MTQMLRNADLRGFFFCKVNIFSKSELIIFDRLLTKSCLIINLMLTKKILLNLRSIIKQENEETSR